MRTTIIITILLLCMGTVSRGEEPSSFYIKLSVMDPDHPTVSRGSGGFHVSEGEYGRLTVTFYGGMDDFQVHSLGGKQLPVTYLQDDMDPSVDLAALTLAGDFYIRPNISPDNTIRLTTVINTLTKTDGSAALSFRFDSQRREVVVPNGGETTLTLRTGDKREIPLVLSVTAPGPLTYVPKVDRSITLANEYSLYNDDAQTYVTKSCKCTIVTGMPEDDGEGECSYRHIFHLSNGNLLLYLVSYRFHDIVWNENRTLAFTVEVGHIYMTNPVDTNMTAAQLQAESTVMNTMQRRIIVRPGERTEIEIPIGADSSLPFKGKEVIVVNNAVEEKVY